MEKFTQIKDKPMIPEDEVIFNGKYLDIIKYKDTEILKINDKVAIIPYFRDEASFLMRLEYLPSFQLKNREKSNLRNITNYLTVVTGSIDDGETPEQTIRRELYEETGIVLNNLYTFDFEGPFFVDKYSTSQIWVCLLELPINSYRQVKPPTDGSKHEKLSRCIRISLADIDQISNNDLITKYLISLLKKRIES
jgi:8-oxo-dGTP pyrophosphatase MutT (NUDIX family)